MEVYFACHWEQIILFMSMTWKVHCVKCTSAAVSKRLSCFLVLIFAAVNAEDVTTRFDSQLVSVKS